MDKTQTTESRVLIQGLWLLTTLAKLEIKSTLALNLNHSQTHVLRNEAKDLTSDFSNEMMETLSMETVEAQNEQLNSIGNDLEEIQLQKIPDHSL